MVSRKITTISVTPETRIKLGKLTPYDGTMDETLQKLIDSFEKGVLPRMRVAPKEGELRK